MDCLNDQCRSPTACSAFGYCREHNMAHHTTTAWAKVEAALGENLVWLADQLDQKVRQKDQDALRRLGQLNEAWKIAANHALRK